MTDAENMSREIAFKCWKDMWPNVDNLIRPSDAFIDTLSHWIETAIQNQKNTDYYKDLVIQCGEIIGKAAYTQDDGELCDSVLCAKVPGLVKDICDDYCVMKNYKGE